MTTLMVIGGQAENFLYRGGRYGIFSPFRYWFDFQSDSYSEWAAMQESKKQLLEHHG